MKPNTLAEVSCFALNWPHYMCCIISNLSAVYIVRMSKIFVLFFRTFLYTNNLFVRIFPSKHLWTHTQTQYIVCVTYPGSQPLDTHSSHWYMLTMHPHRQTHGITVLRLPYTLLYVCLCIKSQWQGADKRQNCSQLASVQATICAHSVHPPDTRTNWFSWLVSEPFLLFLLFYFILQQTTHSMWLQKNAFSFSRTLFSSWRCLQRLSSFQLSPSGYICIHLQQEGGTRFTLSLEHKISHLQKFSDTFVIKLLKKPGCFLRYRRLIELYYNLESLDMN